MTIHRLSLLALLILAAPIMIPVSAPVHAQTAQHAPIVINSNDDFTSDNGVTGGSGTSNDPYMITGWNISDPPGNGITIRNTDAHFIISGILIRWTYDDCSINQCWKHPPNGLLLESVEHGAIVDSQVYLSSGRYALNITFSDDIRVSNNDLRIGDGHVVFLRMSSNLEISNNRLGGGAFTITGSYLTEVTITGNSGGAEDGIELAHVDGILISKNNISAHDPFNIYDCSDVTIDKNIATSPNDGIIVSNCGGFSIIGNTVRPPESDYYPDAGINVANSAGFEVSSNNVTGFQRGLGLISVSEFSVDSFHCFSCTTGILINGAAAGVIEDSQTSQGAHYGLQINSSYNILVRNNYLRGEFSALLIKDSSSIELQDNELPGGLQMESSGNILVQNNHLSARGWALLLKDSSSLDIRNNELGVSGNIMQGTGLNDVNIQGNYGRAEAGASLFNVTNISISNNRFAVDGFSGLTIRGCSDVTIAGNNVTGSGNHFRIENCTNTSISQNTVSVNYPNTLSIYEGIMLTNSTGISISNNQVSHAPVGIALLSGSIGNAVNDNVISSNICGIKTDRSTVDQNDLSNNTFQANTQDYCSA